MVSLARPPDGLFDVVKHAIVNHAHERQADKEEEHPSTPPLAQPPVENVAQFARSHAQQPEDERPWKDDGGKGKDVDEHPPPDKSPNVSEPTPRPQN
ncbi:hypothetical protein GY45DRAFT_1331046 [Cubamyces sp. BRFM 1775]|nr:hypothetical protein GY45DRAFT_1331046 [Cubamyces sp. BRFM 1775]